MEIETNMDIRPTEDMINHFTQRTKYHISLVDKNIRLLANRPLFINLKDELLKRGHLHDCSKFVEPEYIPYIWLTEKFRQMKQNRNWNYPSKEISDSVNEAIHHHLTTNRHHFEYFNNPDVDMSDVDIIEVVADWAAMDQERTNDMKMSPREWYTKTGINKWNISVSLQKRLENVITELEIAL